MCLLVMTKRVQKNNVSTFDWWVKLFDIEPYLAQLVIHLALAVSDSIQLILIKLTIV